MSDSTLALAVTVIIVLVLFAWVPLLHGAEAMTRRSERYLAEEMPDLREDDPSPKLKREVA